MPLRVLINQHCVILKTLAGFRQCLKRNIYSGLLPAIQHISAVFHWHIYYFSCSHFLLLSPNYSKNTIFTLFYSSFLISNPNVESQKNTLIIDANQSKPPVAKQTITIDQQTTEYQKNGSLNNLFILSP